MIGVGINLYSKAEELREKSRARREAAKKTARYQQAIHEKR